MESLKIVIQSLDDVQNRKPLIEGITQGNTESTKDITFCILEGGTVKGDTSLMVVLKTKDGRHIVGEMTKAHFEGLAGALKGAIERFGR